jgi:hypothetical protein
MVCVVEAKPASHILQLLRCEAFQRRLGSYRHEYREGNRPMWKMEGCGAGFGDLQVILAMRQDVGTTNSLSTCLRAQSSRQRA